MKDSAVVKVEKLSVFLDQFINFAIVTKFWKNCPYSTSCKNSNI